MSRSIKFTKAGGPEVLQFVETQVPVPGPHEVRIKVKAIGLNRAESMWRKTKHIETVRFPAGLGYGVAGIVDAVGKEVTGVAMGNLVSTLPAFSRSDYSTYGELITVAHYSVVKHPGALSFTKAASIWVMFVTAVHASTARDLHAEHARLWRRKLYRERRYTPLHRQGPLELGGHRGSCRRGCSLPFGA